jgi:hypothetical protein
MRCMLCRNLELAFEARRTEYIQASSLSSYHVSKKFAAYTNVEMERALMELEEHRSVCLLAGNESAHMPVVPHLHSMPQDAFASATAVPAA